MSKPVPHLLVAADIIIEMHEQIVLIKRKNPPFGWALPGGIVDPGESVEQAAVREAKEETSLDVELKHLLGVYSKPNRDPRGPCMSVTYIAKTIGGKLKASDDAGEAILAGPYIATGGGYDLAFDHADILEDYLRFKGFFKAEHDNCQICGGPNH